jgi:hypothetical protein
MAGGAVSWSTRLIIVGAAKKPDAVVRRDARRFMATMMGREA